MHVLSLLFRPENFLRLFRVLCFALVPMLSAGALKAEEENLFPTENAFIRSGVSADDTFNRSHLELAGRAGDTNRKVYLRFEIPESASTITAATLRLTVRGVISLPSDPENTTFPFAVFAAIDDASIPWDQDSITWNNAPGNQALSTDVDRPWVEVGHTEVQLPLNGPNEPIEIPLDNLPGLLKEKAGQTLTLILVPSVEDRSAPGIDFHSMEATDSSYWPTLILND